MAIAILSGRHEAALRLFFIAALTDTLDGTLARRWDAASRVGAFLDPIADKALLSGVYVAFAITRSAPPWLAFVIFGRDIVLLLSSAGAYAFTTLRQFPPSVWGKLSTLLQILSAIAWMSRNAWNSPFFNAAANGLLWPTVLVTIWSGMHYLWRGWRSVQTH